MACNKINGAVKFFDQNFALFRSGGTADASSNDDAAKFILDISRYTQWESLGSNDLTTETIVVNLKTSKVVDRLFLVDMNFKEFQIQYDNGSGYVDFTNVVGVNGVESSSISETDFAFDSAYYQFDAVTTSRIQITCLKTQVANVQKYLSQIIITEEIGTLEGFPRVQPESSRNETKAKALSRRLVVQKTYETNKVKITFKTHPFQNDLDIIEELFEREEPFLVYPCGGRSGSDYFKVEQMNWRLKDIYNVQITGKLKNQFEKGVYTLGFNKSITMEEHI
jgi:hypothetical protein